MLKVFFFQLSTHVDIFILTQICLTYNKEFAYFTDITYTYVNEIFIKQPKERNADEKI